MVVAAPLPGSAVPLVKNAAVESVTALKSVIATVVNGFVCTQKLVWQLRISVQEMKEDRWSCAFFLSDIYSILSKIN